MRPCGCWRRSSTTSVRGHAWPLSPRTGWWPCRICAASWSGTGSRWWSGRCRGGGWWPPQPVGTLNVYAPQPRAWTPAEVQALGAFAIVTAELVRIAVELANNQLEVAQLRQAPGSRGWIEQAKGMVAATQGVTLDQAFHQLRVRARSSSRKLAEVAQEVVQDVQRERVAAKALDDGRGR